jgi:8-oxo-dGTP pyrophosphatase MutT (NUDIX family)
MAAIDSSALVELLAGHRPEDDIEAECLAQMRRFAVTLPSPLSSEQRVAHFTGSAMVVDPAGERVCLVHHRKLQRWLQPGGHAEPGDAGRMERTAVREAHEEIGLAVRLHPAAAQPFDVDVHPIPRRGDMPAHLHLDVRMLVVAVGEPSHDAEESHGARWFATDEAERVACGDAPDRHDLRRLFAKTRRLLGA